MKSFITPIPIIDDISFPIKEVSINIPDNFFPLTQTSLGHLIFTSRILKINQIYLFNFFIYYYYLLLPSVLQAIATANGIEKFNLL